MLIELNSSTWSGLISGARVTRLQCSSSDIIRTPTVYQQFLFLKAHYTDVGSYRTEFRHDQQGRMLANIRQMLNTNFDLERWRARLIGGEAILSLESYVITRFYRANLYRGNQCNSRILLENLWSHNQAKLQVISIIFNCSLTEYLYILEN